MTEIEQKSTKIEDGRKRIGLWAAAIFAILGLTFLIFWIYNVVLLQQGRVDPSDTVLLPVTILMLTAGVAGYFLIRRNRLMAGLWAVFATVLVPPIAAVMVINNVYIVALAYLVVFAFISITVMFPKPSRRAAIIATAVAILAVVGIQLWNPAFRVGSPTLEGFAPYVIVLGSLALLAFLIRQALLGNIRVKLIISFVILTIIVVAILGSLMQNSYRVSLTRDISTNLVELASARSNEIGQSLERELGLLRSLAMNRAIQDNTALVISATEPLSLDRIEQLDQQWRSADAVNDDRDPIVASVLYNVISYALRDYRNQFPQHVEIFITNTQGVSIASTNRTSDYYQADEEWWQIAYRDGLYIGQPEYDESIKALAVIMAIPIRISGSDEIQGILRTTVTLKNITASLAAGKFGQTGRSLLYLPSGKIFQLVTAENGEQQLLQADSPAGIQTFAASPLSSTSIDLNGVPTLVGQANIATYGTSEDSSVISLLNWRVMTLQNETEALQAINIQARNNILLSVVIAIGAILLAIGLAQLISRPIIRLNTVARRIANGDLTVLADTGSRDEVGALAATFNSMVAQLRNFINTLETRVAERTQSLELAAEVGRSVSQVRALDIMLRDAAEIIRSRFDLYYVQVYLVSRVQNALLLQSGTGTVGAELINRRHRLPLDTGSINGRAAVEKQSVVIADTTSSLTFRPNPLLPETRSEMAVPLMVGEDVVGVLDLQGSTPGSLSSDILPAFEALAGQLAIAIQNANLLTEAEKARQEVEKQARNLVRANWTEYMDAIHQPEKTGYVFDGNNVVPLAEAQDSQPAVEDNTISSTITVTGEPLGSLVVEMDVKNQTSQNVGLVNAVARQVAQQLENLRLLENAERYRVEAEQTARRQTVEGWKSYAGDKEMSYRYDLETVRPCSPDEMKSDDASSLSMPIKVREETIGKLSILNADSNNPEAVELTSTIVERLALHIESLRQYAQTQSALTQNEKLSNVSLRFTQAADLQELLKIAVETLEIPKINRALLGAITYDASDQPDGLTFLANWWNGTGTQVTPVGTHYDIETLKTLKLIIGSEPVFFDDTFNDPRADESILAILQRQNIHAMASLPLILGTRQIGVVLLEAEEAVEFSRVERSLFIAMGPQIATVFESRRQFDRARQQADRETMLNVIGQKIRSATTVEAVLQIAARELGHALGAPLTVAQLGMKDKK